MRTQNKNVTLFRQIFGCFFLIAIFTCTVLSVYFFNSEKQTLEQNLKREMIQTMEFAVKEIEDTALNVEEFANQICQNATVRELMLREDSSYSAQTQEVVDLLDEQFQYVTIAEDILSLFLVG